MTTIPFISVVIPTFARPDQLTACLDAVAELDYPRDRFEVIVVDDGSPMPMETVTSPFHADLRLRLLRQPNQGPSAARNRGARHAAGEFLAFTDDDCAPRPGWLRGLAEALVAGPDRLVGGKVINFVANHACSEASQAINDFRYDDFEEDRWMPFLTSNNIAMAAARFQETGGFDVSNPFAAFEDRDLCDRWRARGWPLFYAGSAEILHRHDLSFAAFWRQHFTYGRGALHLHHARRHRGETGLRPKPFRFYFEMVRYPFGRVGAGRAAVLASLMAVAQVATAVGFAWEGAQRAANRTVVH